MNVFYTNDCPIQTANEHCYVHVVKMLTEHCQMLTTAHHLVDGTTLDWKPTHPDHPSTVWIRSSKAHYDWVVQCSLRLAEIYKEHSGKVHKSAIYLQKLLKAPRNISNKSFVAPPVAAEDKFKAMAIWHDVPTAYQAYLNSKFAEWACREKPIRVEWGNRGSPAWVNF